MLEDFHARKAAEDDSSVAKPEHALFENAYNLPKPGLTQVAANELADWTKDPVNAGLLQRMLSPNWSLRGTDGAGLKKMLKSVS